jgi:hypothetical protein
MESATPEGVALAVNQITKSAAVYEDMSKKAIVTAREHSLEAWRASIEAFLISTWNLRRLFSRHVGLEPRPRSRLAK